MLFPHYYYSCTCPLPLEEALLRIERFQGSIARAQPRINPQKMELRSISRSAEGEEPAKVSVKGYYGSIAFFTIELEEHKFPNRTKTEAGLDVSGSAFGIFMMLIFAALFVGIAAFSGNSPSDLIGLAFLIILVSVVPVYLIGLVALPKTADRLGQFFYAAFSPRK